MKQPTSARGSSKCNPLKPSETEAARKPSPRAMSKTASGVTSTPRAGSSTPRGTSARPPADSGRRTNLGQSRAVLAGQQLAPAGKNESPPAGRSGSAPTTRAEAAKRDKQPKGTAGMTLLDVPSLPAERDPARGLDDGVASSQREPIGGGKKKGGAATGGLTPENGTPRVAGTPRKGGVATERGGGGSSTPRGGTPRVAATPRDAKGAENDSSRHRRASTNARSAAATPRGDPLMAGKTFRMPLTAKTEKLLEKLDPDLRPDGKPDDKPSRHRLAPPASMTLLFNCVSSNFDFISGDKVDSLPEAHAFDLKAARSGLSIGRVKVAPAKGTEFAERVEFPSEWLVRRASYDGLAIPSLLTASLRVRPWAVRTGTVAPPPHRLAPMCISASPLRPNCAPCLPLARASASFSSPRRWPRTMA